MLSLNIPKKIDVSITQDWVIITGPLGSKKKKKSENISLHYDKTTHKLWLLSGDSKEKHFYLSILNKIILGVWKGFSIKLNIVGVGYKVFLDNQVLTLKLEFSHNTVYKIPPDIKVRILSQKLITLVIFGNDFQKVNQVASEIRALKPSEPYKGKGIKYFNEIVKRKEGKKTNV